MHSSPKSYLGKAIVHVVLDLSITVFSSNISLVISEREPVSDMVAANQTSQINPPRSNAQLKF